METPPQTPVTVEYIDSDVYASAKPATEDPFRHQTNKGGANSHNHWDLHPFGKDVVPGSKEFVSRYAADNNRYLYQLWYTDKLAPHMATEVLKIEKLSQDVLGRLQSLVKTVLTTGIDAAMKTDDGQALVASFQKILDDAVKGSAGPIFVRLGATSPKDSFAKGAPTTKPDPLPADANLVLRRLLTSGRVVGRLLALEDKLWEEDPGEVLVVERWSADIQLDREIRVFCYDGKVTAVSQDIWWEPIGWRKVYEASPDGFVESIINVWDNVKEHLPFNACTMDVLMTAPSGDKSWQAKVIEFNGFGAHLNTGSDLFHWVRDNDILLGKNGGVTVRFVNDYEDGVPVKEKPTADPTLPTPPSSLPLDEAEPDWLVLEKELQAKYAEKGKDKTRKEMEEKTTLPLRGRWCSAY